MALTLIAILVASTLIVAVELILWRIFRNKIAGVLFPHDADQSALPLFTMARLEACAVLHAIFLLVCVDISIFLLF